MRRLIYRLLNRNQACNNCWANNRYQGKDRVIHYRHPLLCSCWHDLKGWLKWVSTDDKASAHTWYSKKYLESLK